MDGSWEQAVRKSSEDSVYKTKCLDAVGLMTRKSHKNWFPNALAQDVSFIFYVSLNFQRVTVAQLQDMLDDPQVKPADVGLKQLDLFQCQSRPI